MRTSRAAPLSVMFGVCTSALVIGNPVRLQPNHTQDDCQALVSVFGEASPGA